MKKILLAILLVLILIPSAFAYKVLSVSNVDYVSNDPEVGGKAMLVTTIAGFDQSSYIKAGDIKDTADNTQATKDFNIDIISNEYSCDYMFINNTNFLYNGRMLSKKSNTRGVCICRT